MTSAMGPASKHRHAADGGYQRGEETRARIVVTALKLFGERGFEGASTREIAASAGVNAPALQYYFDSKEGVYLACVEHIVARVWEYMAEVVSRAERLLEGDADDAALIEAFCAIQAQLAELMFTSPDAGEWRLFMARQQAGMGPAAGFQMVYERVSRRISRVNSAIVGQLLGRAPGDDETLIRTMALSGQLMVFQVARRSALTALNWDSIDAERLALIKRVIREQTTALLQSLLATRNARRPSRVTRHSRRVNRYARRKRTG
jgi:TetR/AcrR family transcriptional regulator, regulator of cefoperazone and chloramphenicol sensitivity